MAEQRRRAPREEREHRQRALAAAARVLDAAGATGEGTRLTVRDPEHPERLWVTPADVSPGAVTAGDLLLVDVDGSVLAGTGTVDADSLSVHAAVLAVRPDAAAVVQADPLHAVVWSSTGRLLDPITQDACLLFDDHTTFAGWPAGADTGDDVASALGARSAVLVRGRGVLAVGGSVESAAWFAYAVERASLVQLLAESAGRPMLMDEVCARQTREVLAHPGIVRKSFDVLAVNAQAVGRRGSSWRRWPS